MINIQPEIKLLKEQRIRNAIRYMELNKSLSFHHVANKFKVEADELQTAWAESRKVKR